MVNYMALKKNLDVTIHEAFLEEILRGNWLPGQALNLDELAERYGVSRTPVQQALKRMHTQGMVVFSSKGHFSVPTFSEKEVCDIIEIRLLLEHQALTDIQRKALPVDYQTLDRLARECILSNETDDVVSARRTDLTSTGCWWSRPGTGVSARSMTGSRASSLWPTICWPATPGCSRRAPPATMRWCSMPCGRGISPGPTASLRSISRAPARKS